MRFTVLSKLLAAPTVALLLGGLACLACTPAEESVGEILATTDVGDSIDSRIRPEEDPREEARAELLVGVLPGDFPGDVWVYQPSIVSDFAGAGSAERFVVLRVREEMAAVVEQLDVRLAGDGWRGASLAAGQSTFRKGPRELRVSLQQERGETLIRIEY